MSHSPRYPSDYSCGSSPGVDRSLSVTEASFHGLHLKKTASAQHLLVPYSHGSPSRISRRHSQPRSSSNSEFLQPDLDLSSYRTPSPATYPDLSRASTYGATSLDPQDYQPFSEISSFDNRSNPYALGTSPRANMR